MRKMLTGVGFAALMAAGSAMAADLPVTPPRYKAPPPVYVSSWTGFYAGIGIGGRWMNNDWTTTAAFFPLIGIPIPFTTDPSASFSSGALRISGYAGYNWQIAPMWVVGLEADYGWANNHSTSANIPGLGLQNSGSFTEVKGRWDASVRARAGYLIAPAFLAYVTGGVAFQHVQAIATCPADITVCNPAFGTQSFSNSSNRVGYTIGGGLEAMFARNLLARVEYRYADFGTFSFTAIPFSATTFGANANLTTRTHTVTLGLAYKFDGAGPVVANY